MTMEPEFWSGLGAAAAIFLTATGAAMASAEGGTFALHQKGILAFVPIVQAGVLAIYGIIIAILIVLKQDDETTAITEAQAYRHLAAGLSVGFACWASGYGMSLFLKQCNQTTGMTMTMSTTTNTARGDESQPLLSPSTSNSASGGNHPPAVLVEYKRLIMVLIFLESIGLYGLIAALFLLGK